MGIPLVALSGNPQNATNPITKQNSLAELAQRNLVNTGLGQTNEENALKLQNMKTMQQDQQTFQSTLAANNGDFAKSLKDVTGKISMPTYQTLDKWHRDQIEQNARTGKEGLEAKKYANDQLLAIHDDLSKLPDDQYVAQWPNYAAKINQIQPGAADPTKPIPKDQLEAHGIGLKTMEGIYKAADQKIKEDEAQRKATTEVQAIQKGQTTNAAEDQKFAAETLASAKSDIDYANRQNYLQRRGISDDVLKLFPQSYSDEGMQQVKSMAIGTAEQAKIAGQAKSEDKDIADIIAARGWENTAPNREKARDIAAARKPAIALNIQQAAADKSGMTDAAIDNAAETYWNTGKLPPGGRSATAIAQNRKIMNRAAELHSGESIAEGSSTFAANKKSLAEIQPAFDQMDAFEKTASKNLDVFRNAASKVIDSGSPWINKPLREVDQKALGSTDLAAFDAARTTALTEVGKVLNSAKAGSGVLSDSARQEVESLVPKDASLKQIYSALKVIDTDIKNRHDAYQSQIADIQGRLRGNKKAAPATEAAKPLEITLSGGRKVTIQ